MGVCVHRTGTDATLITYGNLINNVLAAAEQLAGEGVNVTVLRLLSASKLPELSELVTGPVIVAEEACTGSGLKEAIGWALPGKTVRGIDLGADFMPHGEIKELYQMTGLDAGSIKNYVIEVLHREK